MNITERLNKHVAALQTQLDKTFESTELPSAARPYFNEAQRARKMLLEEYKSCLIATDTLSAISSLFPDDAPHKHPETGVSLLDDVRDVIDVARPAYITDHRGSIVYTLPLPLRCIFCTFKGTLEELRQHSVVCPEHPAVKALAEVYKR